MAQNSPGTSGRAVESYSRDSLDDWVRVLEDTGWDGSGWVRPWRSLDRWERIFLLCSCFMLVVPVIISVEVFLIPDEVIWEWVWEKVGNSQAIIAVMFTTYFCLYGVLGERYYELVCAIIAYIYIATLLLLSAPYYAYITGESSQIASELILGSWLRNTFIIICVYVVCLVPLLVLANRLAVSYRDNRHLLIRTLVERKDLIKAAHLLFKYKALLILDLLMSISLCCCFISILAKYTVFSASMNIVNITCFVIGIPMVLIYVLLAMKMVEDENRVCFWFVFILSFYELIEMSLVLSGVIHEVHSVDHMDWSYGVSGLVQDIIIAFAALATRICLLYYMFEVRENFGRGLSGLVFHHIKDTSSERMRTTSYNSLN